VSADVWADVDIAAYRGNLRLVRARVAPADVMVIVKNDAYGHGVDEIVRAALGEGVRFVGVLDIETGLRLRSVAGTDVSLFAWLFSPDEHYGDAVASGIELGVSSVAQLDRILETSAGGVPRIHAKIDTGLGRAGARPEDWPALLEAIDHATARGRLELAGVWTHISEASDDEDTASIGIFEWALARVPDARRAGIRRHLAASAASFARADSRYDLVRVGAFTYGIAPGDGISPQSLGLVPVLGLRARVVAVDSFGRGLLPIGTADGLLGGVDLPVSIDGERTTISVGVTDSAVPGAAVGDVVTLLGRSDRGEPTLQEWADALGTIGEEIVVRLSPRIERRIHGLE
jgi:alanine racemase